MKSDGLPVRMQADPAVEADTSRLRLLLEGTAAVPFAGGASQWRYAARQVGLLKPRAWRVGGLGRNIAGDPTQAAGNTEADPSESRSTTELPKAQARVMRLRSGRQRAAWRSGDEAGTGGD